MKKLQERKHICGMTGDGVNDAPALKKADIGIAVADATDAARGASDIVLTEPGLSVIISAVLTSRAIFQRMKNYTVGFFTCSFSSSSSPSSSSDYLVFLLNLDHGFAEGLLENGYGKRKINVVPSLFKLLLDAFTFSFPCLNLSISPLYKHSLKILTGLSLTNLQSF